jgi:hypothetical protein
MKIKRKKKNISIKILKTRVKIAYFSKNNTTENRSRMSQASIENDHLLDCLLSALQTLQDSPPSYGSLTLLFVPICPIW